jgi:hypothetical protein
VSDGENKLLGSVSVRVTPSLTRSEFDVKGRENAN